MEQHDITAPDVRLHYVRLTNHLDVAFTDRHDGVPVSIGPGKSDNFPIDMASHFFGNVMDPQASFRHVCKRQGWNTPNHLKPSEEDPSKTVAEMLESVRNSTLRTAEVLEHLIWHSSRTSGRDKTEK